MEVIKFDSTRGTYGFMSNFKRCKIFFDGRTYKNSEAAYQSMKTLDPVERDQFSGLAGGESKRAGKKVTLRNDWDEVKDAVMEDVLMAKFLQNEQLKAQLLETGDAILFENTTGWHDNYWGDCSCDKCKDIPGKNMLGKTLMKVRDRLRNEGTEA